MRGKSKSDMIWNVNIRKSWKADINYDNYDNIKMASMSLLKKITEDTSSSSIGWHRYEQVANKKEQQLGLSKVWEGKGEE